MGRAEAFIQAAENLGMGFVVLHEDESVRHVNQAVAELLEAPAWDLEGRPAHCFMDDRNFQTFLEQQTLRRLGQRAPYAISLLSVKKSATRVHIFPMPIFDAAGVFRGSCGLVVAQAESRGVAPMARMPPELASTALEMLERGAPRAGVARSAAARVRLTPAEHDVVERLTPSVTPDELAQELAVLEQDVRALLGSIYAKFGVRNRIELLALLHVLAARDPRPEA